jgi:hypothetical protein
MPKWWRRFRTNEDLADELRVHREMEAEDEIAAGRSETEARRRANLDLGSTTAVIERIRDQEFSTMLESWYRDFVLGSRSLRKHPLFSITAILTVAFGIGANTAIFTLLYGLVLRPLPVAHPEQLAHIKIVSPGLPFSDDGGSIIPYRMLQQFRRQQQSFTELFPRSHVGQADRSGGGLNSLLVDGSLLPSRDFVIRDATSLARRRFRSGIAAEIAYLFGRPPAHCRASLCAGSGCSIAGAGDARLYARAKFDAYSFGTNGFRPGSCHDSDRPLHPNARAREHQAGSVSANG